MFGFAFYIFMQSSSGRKHSALSEPKSQMASLYSNFMTTWEKSQK